MSKKSVTAISGEGGRATAPAGELAQAGLAHDRKVMRHVQLEQTEIVFSSRPANGPRGPDRQIAHAGNLPAAAIQRGQVCRPYPEVAGVIPCIQGSEGGGFPIVTDARRRRQTRSTPRI